MFHVDFQGPNIGSSLHGTLAHELQHMISWHQSPLMETWLDEGFAELANSLVTSGSGPGTGSLAAAPERPAHHLGAGQRQRRPLPGLVPVRAVLRAAVRPWRRPPAPERAGPPAGVDHGVPEPRRPRRHVRGRLRGLDRGEPAGRSGGRGRPLRARRHRAPRGDRPDAPTGRPARVAVGAPVRRAVRRASGDRRRRRAAVRGRARPCGWSAPTPPAAGASGGPTARTASTRP